MGKKDITKKYRNTSITGLFDKCKRGPLNPPIIFKSITEAMDYIKNYKPNKDDEIT